jgi:SAM-dependent methyltransferase
MNGDFSFSYPRYLEAKTTIDNRSLDLQVWRSFLNRIEAASTPVKILDVGGGTGATLLRLLDALPNQSITEVDYTLLDPESDNLSAAVNNISEWAEKQAWRCNSDEEGLRLENKGESVSIAVDIQQKGLFTHAQAGPEGLYDAIVAQAVLDLFDIREAIQALSPCLRSGGTWYLPIHFDGLTAFEPVLDPELDRTIIDRYHESIPTPQSGRALMRTLPSAGSHLHTVGASDWIVHGQEGGYPNDEAYFLRCILHFIHDEVSISDHSEFSFSFKDWMEKRLEQVDTGSLIYLAHQLDVCAIKE